MSRGNIETRYIDGIYVLKFEELNELMEKQYPKYRNNSSYFSLFNFALGGGYNSVYDIADSFSGNTFSMISNTFTPINEIGREIIRDPPIYLNNDINPI